MAYKVVTQNNESEVWETGIEDRAVAQERIDSGKYHRKMGLLERCKELKVVEEIEQEIENNS